MDPSVPSKSRYRFAGFGVSRARRLLEREGREVPLIPRYFDLLLLLLERRHEAVSRREILERVWSDVIVSDGALSQAIRTLRRALGDDPRNPVFIRTVSRHGYRFVCSDVIEEEDVPPASAPGLPSRAPAAPAPTEDPFALPLERLLQPGADEDERREAAETLHSLGTARALERLDRLPGHEAARALLRDTRWA